MNEVEKQVDEPKASEQVSPFKIDQLQELKF